MTFLLRKPRPDEAHALADLHVATWRETYTHLLPADFFSESYVTGRRRMWEHVLAHPREEISVLVAEQDGALVGFAWAGPSHGPATEQPPRALTLYAIYVLTAQHGTGLGQALLDRTLGSEPAMLWVALENPRAIAFYRRNGFEFDGAEETDPAAPAITDARMVR
ncbi:GNAT family N-acetyltransferase [Micrococcus luteus]|uniref:GNAT family N-acetyltransferase n=1 Tax=Micrococcus luteus TaxID=1270 RepID=UPI0006687D46|nr:GNAT family N-acetyltransferase [Micrococcus luteus]MBN6749417.1 GNAT family N-acetyltransferase [Micrococcus luteus]MBN6759415.1 GNAT family N-acetyltransferase [Micrococcus luteus]MBN6800865.1 GNAT family N-acetyltransferase [Micrococcus luteus]TKD53451.1 N-acetyltransferase [Micrococcus luteus]